MNGAIFTLIILALFVGVVIWAFGKKRKTRFEKDAEIPFEDKND
jgi:cytochrome c oxidase cbb3-type subunit IV